MLNHSEVTGNDSQMAKHTTTIGTQEVRVLSRVFDIFSAFREVAPSIPASYAQAFLAVAMNPGQPTGTYAKSIGMMQPVVSRTLLEIGKKSRTGGMGLDLVFSVDDAQDLRVKRYQLTEKGNKLIQSLLKVMARNEKANSQ